MGHIDLALLDRHTHALLYISLSLSLCACVVAAVAALPSVFALLTITMRIALLVSCLLVGALARPQSPAPAPAQQALPIAILLNERTPIDTLGGYSYRFQTQDGVSRSEVAAASGPLNQVVRTGEISFTHPDGTPNFLTFTADANGYQPVSDLLPTPYPLLPWQIDQVRFAERERAAAAAAEAAGATQA